VSNKLALMVCLLVAACGRDQTSDTSDFTSSGTFVDVVGLCENPDILGQELGDISGAGACGISDAVSVQYVSGVRLSQPAVLNCAAANTLANWVTQDAQPVVRPLRSRITEMRVLASYACRSRNSQSGARLSEHALGNAIDIASFTLANGDVVSVEEDWGKGRKGDVLSDLHASACGPFGTVLGPLADRFHFNHFHLDIAEYRSGAFCR